MKSSTHFLAISSLICWGGCLNAYEDILVKGPLIPLSNASFAALITSITTHPLFGESFTTSFASRVMGRFPKPWPFNLK